VVGAVSILNETALVVTRFDRKPDGSKLRLEDFAQILNKPTGRNRIQNDNNSGTGGNNIGTLIDLMEQIYISNFLSFDATAKLKDKSSTWNIWIR
jgi:hypothetical protein